jgi:hypothetical protein
MLTIRKFKVSLETPHGSFTKEHLYTPRQHMVSEGIHVQTGSRITQ